MNNLLLHHLKKAYPQASGPLEILKDVNLTLSAGEAVALIGPSGSGKSTLLHMAGLLDQPTSGVISIQGQEVQHLTDEARTALRRRSLGFVYQFHHLLPEFTALENVCLPQMLQGTSLAHAKKKASDLLSRVGLSHRLDHRPARLSGGEQQRVAIARALINDPAVLLADEPTGNLDEHTGEEVMALILALVKEKNLSALIATHNLALAQSMSRVVSLHDGILTSS